MIDTNALRKKVLDLAIRGKLVPQNPNDEPASVLLERIREEKQRLIRERKIKKDKVDSVIFRGDDNCYYEKVGNSEPVLLEKLPFELPKGWAWCRVNNYVQQVTDFVASGSFASLRENVTYYKTENYALLVKTQDFSNNFTDDLTYTDEHGYNFLSNSNIFGGELILSNVGSIGKIFIVPNLNRKATLAPNAIMVRPYNSSHTKWLYYLFSSNIGLSWLLSIASATAIQKFNKTDFKSLLIPIPPIEEQSRIIQYIESVFGYIDLIENNQNDYVDLVETLKKAILQSAIQGKLVKQDNADEPASKLLARIRTEKKSQLGKKYVESYIFKGDDNRYYEHIGGKSVDITENIPFELPPNWCWARWGDISESIQYGYNAPAKEKGRIKMVRISDIQNSKVVWNSVPYCDIDEEDIKNYTLKAGDILFARTGGTVGKSYLVTEVPEESIYAGYLIRTRYSNQLSSQYLKYFMETNLYWLQLTNGTTATAQPNCNGKTLGKMLLPIPALAEQERIVSKINEIFAQL